MFFFFNDTATTEIYTLSLHDALPISVSMWVAGTQDESITNTRSARPSLAASMNFIPSRPCTLASEGLARSEEHTSELQSQSNLVCRLLLEKKKKQNAYHTDSTHNADN